MVLHRYKMSLYSWKDGTGREHIETAFTAEDAIAQVNFNIVQRVHDAYGPIMMIGSITPLPDELESNQPTTGINGVEATSPTSV